MNHSEPGTGDVIHPVKESLARSIRSRGVAITGGFVRASARRAAGGARHVGLGAMHLGRDAVSGALQAIEEVGGEAGSMVRDVVIGVIEGTNQVAEVTAPVVKEVVIGAVRGSSGANSSTAEVGRGAIEGAVAGAITAGIDSGEAAASAVTGAVEVMEEAGVDSVETARATVSGVVSGVAAVDGDVAAASRAAAYTLIAHNSYADRSVGEMAGVAAETVEAALLEVAENTDVDIEVVVATAAGAVAAAYEMDQTRGNRVRRSVLRKLSGAGGLVNPELAARITFLGEQLAEELPRGRAAWRGRAMYRAGRSLLSEGGIDLAASLAYYTTISSFPIIALAAMAVAMFADPGVVREELGALLQYYFPASSDLLDQAVDQIFSGTLVMGLVALAGTLLGANGLFMAANRSVNRLFGVHTKGVLGTTLTEAALATVIVVLFVLSVWLTALLQVAIGFDGVILDRLGGPTAFFAWLLGVVATVLPAVATGLLFTMLYHYLPNSPVEWRNAAYGGLIAMILFEVGKHLFFWLSGMASHRNAVYGPVAAFVILLMWAFISGLIFLYGAALVRAAGELRPSR